MAEYNVGGIGGVLQQGARPLQGMLAQMLTDRRAAKQLNPMREALLASQAQPQQSQEFTGTGTPAEQSYQQPKTPEQQMILAAAQDPKQFAQLAQNYGPLQLGAAMQQAPRSREIVVHPDDELNKSLKLGLNGNESVIVKLDYDQNDRQIPGFSISTYKTTADNTEATGTNRRSQYPSGTVGRILLTNDVRELNGQPPLTPEETETIFREATMNSTDQQAYRRYVEQQRAAGVPEDQIIDSLDFKMTYGAGNSFSTTIGEGEGKRLMEYATKAQAAVPALRSIEQAYDLIDVGLVAGAGAEQRLALTRALDLMLGREHDAKSAATDAYMAASGVRVAEQITSFGAGTGLSDADRDFARLITAGKIEMTPQALRMALEILARGKLGEVAKYNQTRDNLQGNFQYLKPLLQPVQVPDSIYGRISPLSKAPDGLSDDDKLKFYMNQRPSYLPQGANQQLPPPGGQSGPLGPNTPPGPNASPDEIEAFYNRR